MFNSAEELELMFDRVRLALGNPDFIEILAFLFAFYVVSSLLLSISHCLIGVAFWLLEKARFYYWFRRVFSALPKIDPIDYDFFADLMKVEYSSLKDHLK